MDRLERVARRIEEMIAGSTVPEDPLRADFAEYDAFKAAHARNGAAILQEILQECGVEDEALAREVHRLVCLHEVGGDPRADLLADADSLSYFDVNLPRYYQRHGWEETRRRCVWGYLRLSEPARSIAANLPYPGDQLKSLMAESIREVEAGARGRSGAPEREPPGVARGRSPMDRGRERAR
jgi:hypothetical protein